MRVKEESVVRIFTTPEELRDIADLLEQSRDIIEEQDNSENVILNCKFNMKPFNIDFVLDLTTIKFKDGHYETNF
jgi:uncharacterized protein YpuA (DUF1002 family)